MKSRSSEVKGLYLVTQLGQVPGAQNWPLASPTMTLTLLLASAHHRAHLGRQSNCHWHYKHANDPYSYHIAWALGPQHAHQRARQARVKKQPCTSRILSCNTKVLFSALFDLLFGNLINYAEKKSNR